MLAKHLLFQSKLRPGGFSRKVVEFLQLEGHADPPTGKTPREVERGNIEESEDVYTRAIRDNASATLPSGDTSDRFSCELMGNKE